MMSESLCHGCVAPRTESGLLIETPGNKQTYRNMHTVPNTYESRTPCVARRDADETITHAFDATMFERSCTDITVKKKHEQ
jgi:hypothetical protein